MASSEAKVIVAPVCQHAALLFQRESSLRAKIKNGGLEPEVQIGAVLAAAELVKIRHDHAKQCLACLLAEERGAAA